MSSKPTLNLVKQHKLHRKNENGKRVYLTESGEKYPSVTSVIGKRSEGAIKKWRQDVGYAQANKISRESAGTGTALHTMCEEYLWGRDPAKETHPFAFQLFERIEPHLRKIEVIRGIELKMWSDYLKLAGATDCIANYDGVLSVVDFKNSRKYKKKAWITNYLLQGTAYARMFYDMYGELPKQVVIPIAVWDLTTQLFIEPVKDYYPELIHTMIEHNPLW